MKRFLNDCLDPQNTSLKITPDNDKFKKTIEIINENLGDVIRVKEDGKVKNQVNLPLLDAVFVGIYTNYEKVEKDIHNICNKIKQKVQSDEMGEFIKTGRTHNSNSMKGRIKLIDELVRDA